MTFATFIAALRALEVTGVNRKYDSPPAQVAILPAQYVRLPESNTGIVTFSSAAGMFAAAAEIVIVVESLMQNNSKPNFNATIEIMDALHTAIAAAAAADGYDRWTIRMEIETLGDASYWMVVARVEASG